MAEVELVSDMQILHIIGRGLKSQGHLDSHRNRLPVHHRSVNLTTRRSSSLGRRRNRNGRRPRNVRKTLKSGTKRPPPHVCPYVECKMQTSHLPWWKTISTTLTVSSAATSVLLCISLKAECPSLESSRCGLRTLKNSLIKRKRCSSLNWALTR